MLEPVVGSWLICQCQMIPRVQRGFVALGDPSKTGLAPTVVWPDKSSTTDAMAATARLAAARGETVVRIEAASGKGDLLNIACPLPVNGASIGVISLEVAQTADQQRAVTQLLGWGVSWLQVLVDGDTSAFTRRMRALVEVADAAVQERGSDAAAAATASKLAMLVTGTRVSIGLRERGGIRVRAISGTRKPRRRAELIRCMEAVMDEAAARAGTLLHPTFADDGASTEGAVARLASQRGSGAVCCVPMRSLGRVVGSILLERPAPGRFDVPTVELCEAVAVLLGPVLELERRDEQTTMSRLWRGPAGVGGARRRWLTRIVLASLAVIAAVLISLPVPHRITAPTVIESAEIRVLVAPQAGFLAAAPHRAGARVERGEILASLDDVPLTLEKVKLEAERDQLRKERRSTLVGGDRARTRILTARIEQTDAALALVRMQLARAQVEATFAGVIVSGDLSQSLGAAGGPCSSRLHRAAITARCSTWTSGISHSCSRARARSWCSRRFRT